MSLLLKWVSPTNLIQRVMALYSLWYMYLEVLTVMPWGFYSVACLITPDH